MLNSRLIVAALLTSANAFGASPRPLADKLDQKAQESAAKAPPEKLAVMNKDTEVLRRSDILKKAAKVGDRIPEFSLPDARGGMVKSRDLLKKGPIVLTFYRGGWCPYCNLQLREYQKSLPSMTELGGQLVAISPEKPDETLSTSQKHELAFSVLSDQNHKIASAMGLVFQVPDDLKKIYREFGIDLEKNQGDPEWRLPLPATFVVGRDGKIAWRFIDVDYKKRAEPADIIAALEALKSASKAAR